METLLYLIDAFLFLLFSINVIYMLVYSIASHLPYKSISGHSVDKLHHIAILIPAYREDRVILETVKACLKQNYPSDKYAVVVISDQMQPETNDTLSKMPVQLVKVSFPKSTKSKSLNAAMKMIGDDYDLALILDADNIIPPSYLSEINAAYADPAIEIVQTHRVAKNKNNNMSYLDAVSEEINNSIFRLGHVNLGLSASLIGSGMVFKYGLFKQIMQSVKAVGGFDRELELRLLHQRKRFYYLPKTYVYDEKIQSVKDFDRQRLRWLSAQIHYAVIFSGYFFRSLITGNWDFCDKYLQQLLLPRLLLLGFTALLTVLTLSCQVNCGLKWLVLLILVSMALLLSIPREFYNARLMKSVQSLPNTFYVMTRNLFKLRGANNNFIHTNHGLDENKK